MRSRELFHGGGPGTDPTVRGRFIVHRNGSHKLERVQQQMPRKAVARGFLQLQENTTALAASIKIICAGWLDRLTC